MIFKIKHRNKHYGEWVPWFAWYPVRLINSRIAWLQMVERKREHLRYPIGFVTWYRITGEKDWLEEVFGKEKVNVGEFFK